MSTLFTILRTVIYMIAFIGFWGWLALEVRPLDQTLGLPALPAALSAPGVALLTIGGVIVLACGIEFSTRGQGTPALFDAPRRFVATGPYRFVRNPMYVGGITAFLGLALFLGSTAVLVLATVFTLLVHLLVVLYEEPHLRELFGDSYGDYTKRVRRWIPRFRA